MSARVAPARGRREHHLVVRAHPRDDSFNRALTDAIVDALADRGDAVETCDLHAEGFDPRITPDELERGRATPPEVAREQARVARADHLVFVYPVWWHDRPAILKGWCDRVLRPGFAYRSDPTTGVVRGLLGAKRATIVTTLGAAEGELEERDFVGAFAHGTLGFCGVTDVNVVPLFAVPRATDAEREAMLQRAARDVATGSIGAARARA